MATCRESAIHGKASLCRKRSEQMRGADAESDSDRLRAHGHHVLTTCITAIPCCCHADCRALRASFSCGGMIG